MKRYTVGADRYGATSRDEEPDGEWVLASDALALQFENERLKGELYHSKESEHGFMDDARRLKGERDALRASHAELVGALKHVGFTECDGYSDEGEDCGDCTYCVIKTALANATKLNGDTE